jgi:signal peptidase
VSTHPAHALPRRHVSAGLSGATTVGTGGVADWARIVTATVARGVVAALLGLAFWAVAPMVLGWQPTTVMTGSMAPRIQVGDVVVSRPVDPLSLHQGQVLLFDDPDQAGHLRLHRFDAPGVDGAIVTRGDANPSADSSPVARDAVHGVAMVRVPAVGAPVVWAREGDWAHLGLAAAALVVLLVLTTLDAPLRRRASEASGVDDDTSPPGGGEAAVEEARRASPTTPRRLHRRLHRRTRRRRATAAVSAVVVATSTIGLMLPAEAVAAAFLATTASPTSTLTTTTVVAPTALTCTNTSGSSGVVIGWSYAGETPASFELLRNGAVVGTATGTQRTITYDQPSLLDLGTRYPITVRTTLVGSWTATAITPTSVQVTALVVASSVRC